MKRTLLRAALVAAAVSLAACTGERGARGSSAPADSMQAAPESAGTQPAGTEPAPTPQTNAAPQTAPNTPPADFSEAPVTGRDTVHHMGAGQTYASCMARARAAKPDERPLVESTCRQLPDAPR